MMYFAKGVAHFRSSMAAELVIVEYVASYFQSKDLSFSVVLRLLANFQVRDDGVHP